MKPVLSWRRQQAEPSLSRGEEEAEGEPSQNNNSDVKCGDYKEILEIKVDSKLLVNCSRKTL